MGDMFEIMQALNDYINYREKLVNLAKRQYVGQTYDCPLNGIGTISHRGLSQALWGLGTHEWTCEFCGELFTD